MIFTSEIYTCVNDMIFRSFQIIYNPVEKIDKNNSINLSKSRHN